MFKSTEIKALFEMADAAYADYPQDVVEGFCHREDIPYAAIQKVFGHYDDTLRASIFQKEKKVVISFRGSANVKNFLVHDLRFPFQRIADSVKSFAEGVWSQIKKDYPNCKVVVTGHSLGGAIATYVGVKFQCRVLAIDSPGIGIEHERENPYWSNVSHIHANSIVSGINDDPIPEGQVIRLSGGTGALVMLTNHTMSEIRRQLEKQGWSGKSVQRAEQIYRELGGKELYSTLPLEAKKEFATIAKADRARVIASRIARRVEEVRGQDRAHDEDLKVVSAFQALEQIPVCSVIGKVGLTMWQCRNAALKWSDGSLNRVAQKITPLFQLAATLSPVFYFFAAGGILGGAVNFLSNLNRSDLRIRRNLDTINQGIIDLSKEILCVSEQVKEVSHQISGIREDLQTLTDRVNQGFLQINDQRIEDQKRDVISRLHYLMSKGTKNIDGIVDLMRNEVRSNPLIAQCGVFNGLPHFSLQSPKNEQKERFIQLARTCSAERFVKNYLAIIFRLLTHVDLNPKKIDEMYISNVEFCSYIVQNGVLPLASSLSPEKLASTCFSIQEILKPTKEALILLIGNISLLNQLFEQYGKVMKEVNQNISRSLTTIPQANEVTVGVLLQEQSHKQLFVDLDVCFFLLKFVCHINGIALNEQMIWDSVQLKAKTVKFSIAKTVKFDPNFYTRYLQSLNTDGIGFKTEHAHEKSIKHINSSYTFISLETREKSNPIFAIAAHSLETFQYSQPEGYYVRGHYYHFVKDRLKFVGPYHQNFGVLDEVDYKISFRESRHLLARDHRFFESRSVAGCILIAEISRGSVREYLNFNIVTLSLPGRLIAGCIELEMNQLGDSHSNQTLKIQSLVLDRRWRVFATLRRSRGLSLFELCGDGQIHALTPGPEWSDAKGYSDPVVNSTLRTVSLGVNLYVMVYKYPSFELHVYDPSTLLWKECTSLKLDKKYGTESEYFSALRVERMVINGIQGLLLLFPSTDKIESYWYDPLEDSWQSLPSLLWGDSLKIDTFKSVVVQEYGENCEQALFLVYFEGSECRVKAFSPTVGYWQELPSIELGVPTPPPALSTSSSSSSSSSLAVSTSTQNDPVFPLLESVADSFSLLVGNPMTKCFENVEYTFKGLQNPFSRYQDEVITLISGLAPWGMIGEGVNSFILTIDQLSNLQDQDTEEILSSFSSSSVVSSNSSSSSSSS